MSVLGLPTTPPFAADTLWALRQKVAEFSGRYDLITADGEDNGLDFFIQAGQRFLDRLLDTDRLTSRVVFPIRKGNSVVRLDRVRAIKQCWLQDIKGAWKYEMEKMAAKDYIVEVLSEGRPHSFAVFNLRHAYSTIDKLAFPANFFAFSASDDSIDAVQLFPRADGDYLLIVLGLFQAPPLNQNKSKNFWTVHYPEILIQSTLLQIEKFMRNSEGVRDQLNALQLEVQSLDFDHVTQQIEGVDQMEG